jgi:putative redox protein
VKATARRSTSETFTHSVEIRNHQLVVDEPEEFGGNDQGPSPQELLAASLATCTAVTIEMYAKRKGWDIGTVEVAVEYTPAERGCPTKFSLDLRLPAGCTDDQRERLQVIAAKCPVHRTLEGEVIFEDRVTICAEPGAPERPKHEPLLGGAPSSS